jgi:hypothetical protein
MPEFVKPGATMHYRGRSVIHMPGLDPYAEPREMTVAVKAVERDVAQVEITVTQRLPGGGPGASSTNKALFGKTCPMWINPEALARLRKGQVLEGYPTLGTRLVVQDVGTTPDGTAYITFHTGNDAYQAWSTYDTRSGMMLASTLTRHDVHNTLTFQLESAR